MRAAFWVSITLAFSIASQPLPTGEYIEQSDGTSWMAGYCLTLLAMAMELAREDSAYEDVASKFFEHFRLHRRGHESNGRRGDRAVGRAGRLLL